MRVRVARGVRLIVFATSLVTRPVPSPRVARMACSVLSSAVAPTCSSHSVTLNRLPISAIFDLVDGLECRRCKPCFAASSGHALDVAAQWLDQTPSA